MIKINLMPGSGKKKKGGGGKSIDIGAMLSRLSGRLRDKFMIGAVAGVVIGGGAIGGLWTQQMRQDSVLTAHEAEAVKDSTQYAIQLRERYHAQAVRDTLLRQVNMIHSLDNNRYIWPHIMDEVSRALPQYTWLTLMASIGTPQGSDANIIAAPKDSAKKKDPKKRLNTDVPDEPVAIRITGRTVDIQALTRFMRDLSDSPFLTNVQIEKSELAMDQGKEVTQFQLTLAYRRPLDMTVLHLVPLSLSVK